MIPTALEYAKQRTTSALRQGNSFLLRLGQQRKSLLLCAYTWLERCGRHDWGSFLPKELKVLRRKAGLRSKDQKTEGPKRTCGRSNGYVAVKPECTSEYSALEKKRKTSYQHFSRSKCRDLLFLWSVERHTFESTGMSTIFSLGNRNMGEIGRLRQLNAANGLCFFFRMRLRCTHQLSGIRG